MRGYCLSASYLQETSSQFVECLRSFVLQEAEGGPDIVQNAERDENGLYERCFDKFVTEIVHHKKPYCKFCYMSM